MQYLWISWNWSVGPTPCLQPPHRFDLRQTQILEFLPVPDLLSCLLGVASFNGDGVPSQLIRFTLVCKATRKLLCTTESIWMLGRSHGCAEARLPGPLLRLPEWKYATLLFGSRRCSVSDSPNSIYKHVSAMLLDRTVRNSQLRSPTPRLCVSYFATT